jgi:hypothetical protein
MLRPKSPPLSIDCMTCGAKMALTAAEPKTIELCTPTAARRHISNSLALRAPTSPESRAAGTCFVRAALVGTRVGDAVGIGFVCPLTTRLPAPGSSLDCPGS